LCTKPAIYKVTTPCTLHHANTAPPFRSTFRPSDENTHRELRALAIISIKKYNKPPNHFVVVVVVVVVAAVVVLGIVAVAVVVV
jgi:hypothetical protein